MWYQIRNQEIYRKHTHVPTQLYWLPPPNLLTIVGRAVVTMVCHYRSSVIQKVGEKDDYLVQSREEDTKHQTTEHLLRTSEHEILPYEGSFESKCTKGMLFSGKIYSSFAFHASWVLALIFCSSMSLPSSSSEVRSFVFEDIIDWKRNQREEGSGWRRKQRMYKLIQHVAFMSMIKSPFLFG